MAGKPIDISGNRYGGVVVIKMLNKPSHVKWAGALTLCRCDCGKTFEVRKANLVSGNTKSCGCGISRAAQKDLKGQRFGNVVAIESSKVRDKYGSVVWKCLCDCGNIAELTSKKLSDKKGIKSCGCKNLVEGESAFNKLYDGYKRGAENRGYVWKLSKEQVKIIFNQHCYYCGIEPLQIYAPKHHNGSLVYNGIDRLDNSKGYTIDNVVPCCGNCNIAKRAFSVSDFKGFIKRIYVHWASK